MQISKISFLVEWNSLIQRMYYTRLPMAFIFLYSSTINSNITAYNVIIGIFIIELINNLNKSISNIFIMLC